MLTFMSIFKFLITVLVLFLIISIIIVPFTFDPCKIHSVQLLDFCCISGSLTISLLTFRSFTLATTSAAGGVQGQFTDLQVPTSSSSIISGWTFPSQQPTTDVTSTLQHTAPWQFHESDWQEKEEEVSLCLVRCCGTHYHWLSVMHHWHWLSLAHEWRLFCFPETTGHHHSASVTVSAVKFVCMNTNLLTYNLKISIVVLNARILP